MTHDNICNCFRACGIYPFDADVIPDTALEPAAFTEVTEPETMIALPPVSLTTIKESEVKVELVYAVTTNTASESDYNILLSVLKDTTNNIFAEARMNTVHFVASISTKSSFQQFLPSSQFKEKKVVTPKKKNNKLQSRTDNKRIVFE